MSLFGVPENLEWFLRKQGLAGSYPFHASTVNLLSCFRHRDSPG